MPTRTGKRILLVTNRFGWGGAEKQLEHLAIGLARAGHEVTLLSIGGKHIDISALEAEPIEIVVLDARTRQAKLRGVPRMVRYARAAEVVHCTGWDATLWGRIAAFIARRPVVITEHTPGRVPQVAGTEGRAGARTIANHNRILDHVTYATIAVGAWQRELLESEGVRAEAIVHIPNGVPVEQLRRAAEDGPDQAELGIPDGALVVVLVARFAPQKGQATMLRVANDLRGRLGDIRLLYVGGGPHEQAVKEEAERLGADWAMFLGFRDDVPGLIKIADLSVLPSEGEGLPMSLIESMALGTAIVATDVGDVGWFLDTTGAGISVPANDEPAFAAATAEVLGDATLRARLDAAALSSAARFDSPAMVRRYEQVLEAAIESAPLPLTLGE